MTRSRIQLTACALAAAAFLTACGGGGTTPDTTAPTVTITDDIAAATATGPVTFTFSFDKSVGDSFTLDDIEVSGGTPGAFSMNSSGTSATLVITPSANTSGSISVSIAPGKFMDLSMNANVQSVTASQAFNTSNETTPTPPSSGTTIADFDTVVPVVRGPAEGGTGFITTEPPAGGATGSALAVLRSGGQAWALNVLEATLPFTADRKTLSAKVYSPTANIRMVMKVEGPGGAVEVDANETVQAGWQTLTWTFAGAKTGTGDYNLLVVLPNLGTVDAEPGKTYYFDDIKLNPAPEAPVTPPSPGTDTVVADFDTVVPVVRGPAEGGTGFITTEPPAGGATGSALAVLRSGGQAWALNVLEATLPFTADRKTLSAKVYSPTANIRMVMKVEGPGGAVEVDANETVQAGWQTLTWTFAGAKTGTGDYNLLVVLPNLGTVDAEPGKTYYFDDIKLKAGTSSTNGGGSSTPAPTPGGELGSGGSQSLVIATGDVKTGDGGNTMFVANEGIFSVNYVGSAEPTPPNNLAAWPNAKTANFGSLTGISGGDIGYFQDDINLSNSNLKVDEGGWVAGTAVAPNGVPNFFRYFVLSGQVSQNAYMGLYVNAPNNGTVNASNFDRIKFKVWGPAPMFERSFDPTIEVTLTGPKISGCTTTGSGGTEITQTFRATLKNGAGGFYTLRFGDFTVKGLCGNDTNQTALANVKANLARVVFTVPGNKFNYSEIADGNYTTGLNLGPIGFTNN